MDRLSYQARPGARHPGQRIFQQGRTADRFWLLRSGEVTLDFPVPGRGDIAIETITAGSVPIGLYELSSAGEVTGG